MKLTVLAADIFLAIQCQHYMFYINGGVQSMLYNVMARIEVHFVLTTKNKWLTNLVEEKKNHINHTYTNLLRYKLTSNHGEALN